MFLIKLYCDYQFEDSCLWQTSHLNYHRRIFYRNYFTHSFFTSNSPKSSLFTPFSCLAALENRDVISTMPSHPLPGTLSLKLTLRKDFNAGRTATMRLECRVWGVAHTLPLHEADKDPSKQIRIHKNGGQICPP